MVGRGTKPSSKAAYKVKPVKPIKKAVPKIQKSLDSYRMSHPNVIAANSDQDQDVDHEAHVNVDSAEWADIEADSSLCPPHLSLSSQQSLIKPARLDPSSSKPSTSTLHGTAQSWAQVASPEGSLIHPWADEAFNTEMVRHKAQVAPVFLAYHQVNAAPETRVPLFQIASAVAQAVGGGGLDAIQPMWKGWYIYMCTQSDRDQIIQKGLVVAGKQIMLRLELNPLRQETVKVTLKDLLLHKVSNEETLEALKEVCPVQSEVHYSNVWHNGKPITIWNRDQFVYVALVDVIKLPMVLDVAGERAHVFKPAAMTMHKCCGKTGHHPGDQVCPAKAPDALAESVETFLGKG